MRDDTGTLGVVFFNQPWRSRQLAEGTEAIFWGKVGEYRSQRQMVNPVVDVVAGVDEPAVGRRRRTLRILPVYPASAKAGLTSWEIGTFVEEALERAGDLVDPLPEEWRASLDLWGRTEAFRTVHGPETMDVVEPGPPPPRLRRAPPAPAGAGPAPAGLRAQRPGHPPPGLAARSQPGRRTAPWWRGSWPACPSR